MNVFTPEEILEAKKALLQNVTRVREGNTWVEYGSPAALRQAIEYAEAQNSASVAPRGTRLVRVSSGYDS